MERLRDRVSGASVATFLGLTAILTIAAALRLWGWDYGLPHPMARPDEEMVVGSALRMFVSGRTEPVTFAYPTLSIYLDTLMLHAYLGIGKLLGNYDDTIDMLTEIAAHRPDLHYRIARALSLVLGVATVAATYALAKISCRSRRAGLLAGALVATCLLHVVYSRFATVDVIATLFVTLTLVAAVKAATGRKLASFAIAGTLAGLSASVKYNAVLVGLSLAVPVTFALFTVDRADRWPLVGRLALAGACAGAAFAVTSPWAVLRFGEVQLAMSTLSHTLHTASGEPAMWVHLRDTFPLGLGWPFFLTALAGFARAVWRRRAADLVLLGFAVPFFLSMIGVRLTFPRYVLPLVPVLAVLASEVTVDLLSPFRPLVALPVVALLLVPGAYRSGLFDHLAAQKDTRVLAAEWIGDNLPSHSRIAICAGYGAPVVNEDRRRQPVFAPVQTACSVHGVLGSRAPYVVTHGYPPLGYAPPIELYFTLRGRGRVLARFDPTRRDAEEVPHFFRDDMFFLPMSGFRALARGGPIVTVWEIDRENPTRAPGS